MLRCLPCVLSSVHENLLLPPLASQTRFFGSKQQRRFGQGGGRHVRQAQRCGPRARPAGDAACACRAGGRRAGRAAARAQRRGRARAPARAAARPERRHRGARAPLPAFWARACQGAKCVPSVSAWAMGPACSAGPLSSASAWRPGACGAVRGLGDNVCHAAPPPGHSGCLIVGCDACKSGPDL